MTTIQELRKHTGLSQRKFAERFHLSVKTLQRWECGQTKTPESMLFLLQEVITHSSENEQKENVMTDKTGLLTVPKEERTRMERAIQLMTLDELEEDSVEYRQPLEPLEKEIMEALGIPCSARNPVTSFEEFVAQEEQRRTHEA